MKEDIIILDFFDSFTYNIASEVEKWGISLSVHQDFFKIYDKLLKTRKKKVLLLGPGPGHPDDYKEIFPYLKKLLGNKNLGFLGICLGHQILWRIQGEKIQKSANPMHGRSVPFIIPPWGEFFPKSDWGLEVQVQRYNSLVVRPTNTKNFFLSDGEVLAGKFERGLTYQFHPESIGTSNSSMFFRPLKKFLSK